MTDQLINFDTIPEGIIIKTTAIFLSRPSPFDSEEAFIDKAVEKRKSEFRTGRYLTRLALEELGLAPCAINSGPNRQPLWPRNVVGSISHCSKLCVSAIASSAKFQSIGIDVELNNPIPSNIHPMIFSSEESHSRAHASPLRRLDLITFSAKESIFKCIFPLVGFYFDFQEVSLNINEEASTFTAHLPNRVTDEINIMTIQGIFNISPDLIFSLTYIENE